MYYSIVNQLPNMRQRRQQIEFEVGYMMWLLFIVLRVESYY